MRFRDKDSKDRYLDYRCTNPYFEMSIAMQGVAEKEKYSAHSARRAFLGNTS